MSDSTKELSIDLDTINMISQNMANITEGMGKIMSRLDEQEKTIGELRAGFGSLSSTADITPPAGGLVYGYQEQGLSFGAKVGIGLLGLLSICGIGYGCYNAGRNSAYSSSNLFGGTMPDGGY